VRLTVHEEIPEDPELIRAWNGLAKKMDPAEVFFTHEWALAASRAFCGSVKPLLFLLYDPDQLCGVASLARERTTTERAFFLAGSTADYCDVLSAPERRGEVLRAVLEEAKKRGVREMTLANLPSESTTFRELRGVAKASGYRVSSRIAYKCGLVNLGSEEQRLELLESRLRGARQQRELKKLAKLGTVRVRHMVTAEEVGENLETIVSAHVLRFSASGRISPLIQRERRGFLEELSERLGRAGWLKVSQLEISGLPVAWNYGFRFAGSWFWYLGTFRIEHEDLSPGLCLLRLLVEEGCADLSLRRLDLGLGDEPYKHSFVNGVRETMYVQLSSTLSRHAMNIGRQMVTRIAGHLPTLAEGVRWVRERLRGGTRASLP
jgi:CelD/BcsL family acetyltransferase involved in cellulose biosynthesis